MFARVAAFLALFTRPFATTRPPAAPAAPEQAAVGECRMCGETAELADGICADCSMRAW